MTVLFLEIFHVVVDLGGVELLSFQVISDDLVLLFHLVQLCDELKYLIFGSTVLLYQRVDAPSQIIKKVVFVIPLFPDNLIVTKE